MICKPVRGEINGSEYVITFHPDDPTGPGWKVVCNAQKTDRFWRVYWVKAERDGRPLQCSCPDCFHRGTFCKHMRAIEAVYQEKNPQVIKQLEDEAIHCGLFDRPGTPPEESIPPICYLS